MARVIKSGSAPRPSRDAAARERRPESPRSDETDGTGEANDDGYTRPFDPRVEAERILADARKEAERLRAQATTEGRERGLAAVTELLAGARLSAMRAQREVESDLRTLAVRIAERILDRELSTRPEAVVDIAAAALSQAGAPRDVVLRVHPEDLRTLERGRPRLLERCARAQVIQLRPDSTVGRGGCIVETELGTVDARLQVQLEAIERALRGTDT